MGAPQVVETSGKSQEFSDFSKAHICSAVISFALFVTCISLAGLYFKTEIAGFADWISGHFGWFGLGLLTLIGDSFPSPFPPDIALLVIAKGPLRAQWPLYLSVIVLASFLAGHLAYLWGCLLSYQAWLPTRLKHWPQRHQGLIKRWGARVVIIGALTPLPFSLTCMSAGFVGLGYRKFIWASLWRVPRILIFYFTLHFL